MSPASFSGRPSATHALVLLLLAASVVGCPGPEPDNLTGDGGGAAAATSTGATSSSSSSSSQASSTSGATTGAGGSAGAGGDGGDGSTTSAGGSAPAGTGGHGGGGTGGCDAELESDPLNCGACGRACSNLEADDVICESGRCKQLCRDGFSSVTAPEAPADDDGCETAWRRVFVTRDPQPLPLASDGNPAGASAADAICGEIADAAGLDGAWRAWISDDLIPPPRERFTPHEVPYWLLDGTVIAERFDDVVDGALDAPIHVTESEDSLFDLFPQAERFPVWTATDELGEAMTEHCANWAPDNGAEAVAQVGVVADYDAEDLEPSAWTRFPTALDCFQEAVRLYCFEQ